jgi:chemotaxis protein MotA
MSTAIGIIIAIIAIGIGMILKGVSPDALVNPAAFLIIFGGTIATIFVAFPLSDVKNFPKLIKIAFTEPQFPKKEELIQMFVEWSHLSRTNGFLALEEVLESVKDPFLKMGLEMIIDGSNKEAMEEILLEEVEAIEERHRSGALMFTQAGTYAPTLGVLGAVVGLIAALGNLQDIEKLGHSIAAAFVATLLGIFTGYVLWHPIANKLKQISRKEQEIKYMMIEGLLAIQEGMNPRRIEKKLLVYIPLNQRNKQEERKDAQKEEAVV